MVKEGPGHVVRYLHIVEGTCLQSDQLLVESVDIFLGLVERLLKLLLAPVTMETSHMVKFQLKWQACIRWKI